MALPASITPAAGESNARNADDRRYRPINRPARVIRPWQFPGNYVARGGWTSPCSRTSMMAANWSLRVWFTLLNSWQGVNAIFVSGFTTSSVDASMPRALFVIIYTDTARLESSSVTRPARTRRRERKQVLATVDVTHQLTWLIVRVYIVLLNASNPRSIYILRICMHHTELYK